MFPNLNDRTWTEDDLGMLDDAGSVGGDIQISDAPERRFALKLHSGEFAVLIFCAYVASEDENRHEGDVVPEDAWVQIQVHYCHCTDLEDIGGTESYADYRYWDGPGQGMSTLDDAKRVIAGLTQEDLSEATRQLAV